MKIQPYFWPGLTILLTVILSFSFGAKSPGAGWNKISHFSHGNDSFLLAPISFDYPWDVKRDSAGKFYAYDHRKLTAKDTMGFPRNAHVLMDRKGDYPAQEMNNRINVRLLRNDTLKITVWLGDGEWFNDYVIRAKGKYFKSGCEPDNPIIARNDIEDSLHYHTTSQLLELDRKKYTVGDSVFGFMDCHFEMSRTPDHMDQLLHGARPWKANIELVGTFKAAVLCDTCSSN